MPCIGITQKLELIFAENLQSWEFLPYAVRYSEVYFMSEKILSFDEIFTLVKPVAEHYRIEKIYLFGSYARGEATEDSDLDFLVLGGKNFKLTRIFALAEDLREIFRKNVDVFEVNELNLNSDFYNVVMKERVLVA